LFEPSAVLAAAARKHDGDLIALQQRRCPSAKEGASLESYPNAFVRIDDRAFVARGRLKHLDNVAPERVLFRLRQVGNYQATP
jgi:hypothetical protein